MLMPDALLRALRAAQPLTVRRWRQASPSWSSTPGVTGFRCLTSLSALRALALVLGVSGVREGGFTASTMPRLVAVRLSLNGDSATYLRHGVASCVLWPLSMVM